MRQNKDVPVAGTAAMVAIGGSAGVILAGSTLERALIGLALGMAIGLASHATWRFMRGRSVPRSVAPTPHPA